MIFSKECQITVSLFVGYLILLVAAAVTTKSSSQLDEKPYNFSVGNATVCHRKLKIFQPVRVEYNNIAGEGYCLFRLPEVSTFEPLRNSCETIFGGHLFYAESFEELQFLLNKVFNKVWVKPNAGNIFMLGYNISIINNMDNDTVEKLFADDALVNLTDRIDNYTCFILDYDYVTMSGRIEMTECSLQRATGICKVADTGKNVYEETNTNYCLATNNDDYVVNYTEAEEYCKYKFNGHLLSIHSYHDAEFVLKSVGLKNIQNPIFLGIRGSYRRQRYTDNSSTVYLMQFFDPDDDYLDNMCYYLDTDAQGLINVKECKLQQSFMCLGPVYKPPTFKRTGRLKSNDYGIIAECVPVSNQLYPWKPVVVDVNDGGYTYCLHDILILDDKITSFLTARLYCKKFFAGELLSINDNAELNFLSGLIFEPFDDILPIKFSMRLLNIMTKDLNQSVPHLLDRISGTEYLFDINGDCLALVRIYEHSKDYIMPVKCNRNWKHLTCKTRSYRTKKRVSIRDRRNPEGFRQKLNSNLQMYMEHLFVTINRKQKSIDEAYVTVVWITQLATGILSVTIVGLIAAVIMARTNEMISYLYLLKSKLYLPEGTFIQQKRSKLRNLAEYAVHAANNLINRK